MSEKINMLYKMGKMRDYSSIENSNEDEKNKQILLSEIPYIDYTNVLHIGCKNGLITRELPGEKIVGIDASDEFIIEAKKNENKKLRFYTVPILKLPYATETFDLIVITEILYEQYIGKSLNLVYYLVNRVLKTNGVLITVHDDRLYSARFPYILVKEYFYDYRGNTHRLEVYVK